MQHLARMDRKLAELHLLRTALADLVDRCNGDNRPDCPIMDELAEVGGDGRTPMSDCAHRYGARGWCGGCAPIQRHTNGSSALSKSQRKGQGLLKKLVSSDSLGSAMAGRVRSAGEQTTWPI